MEVVLNDVTDKAEGALGITDDVKSKEKLVKVGVLVLSVLARVIWYCTYLSESVTQLFEEISTPEEIAPHDENAIAPVISEVLEVLTLTVTEVFAGVVAV